MLAGFIKKIKETQHDIRIIEARPAEYADLPKCKKHQTCCICGIVMPPYIPVTEYLKDNKKKVTDIIEQLRDLINSTFQYLVDDKTNEQYYYIDIKHENLLVDGETGNLYLGDIGSLGTEKQDKTMTCETVIFAYPNCDKQSPHANKYTPLMFPTEDMRFKYYIISALLVTEYELKNPSRHAFTYNTKQIELVRNMFQEHMKGKKTLSWKDTDTFYKKLLQKLKWTTE